MTQRRRPSEPLADVTEYPSGPERDWSRRSICHVVLRQMVGGNTVGSRCLRVAPLSPCPTSLSMIHDNTAAKIVVRDSAGAEEDMQAYRVRFQCLTMDLGDHRYADEAAKTYIDPWDCSPRKLAVACSNATVMGTTRYMLRRDAPFPREDIYDFDEIATRLSTSREAVLDGLVLADRGGVLADFRGRGIFSMLLDHVEQFGRRAGQLALVGLVSDHDDRMARVLERKGWDRLSAQVVAGEWQGRLHMKPLA